MLSPDRAKIGEIIPRITGSLSVVSSMMIIFLVLNSSTGLSSTYHRIMLVMSVADILSSSAMALTHLPMPRPGMSAAVDAYEYEGLRLGNTETCTAQGFLIVFGIVATYSYNIALCIYYASAIYLKVKPKTIRNRIEPFLHLLPVSLSLFISVPNLIAGNYNPAEAWCGLIGLPNTCQPDDCGRGRSIIFHNTETTKMIAISLIFVVILSPLISLGLVCWTVFSDYRTIVRHEKERIESTTGDNGNDDDQSIANDNESISNSIRNTNNEILTKEQIERHIASNKYVLWQALSYMGALILTLVFPILIILVDDIAHGADDETFRFVIRLLQLIFQPMQGFFNFMIFLSSKVYTQLNLDRNQSIMDIMKKISKRRYNDPIFLSKLSIVQSELKIYFDDQEDLDEDEHDIEHENEHDIEHENEHDIDKFVENVSYPSNISSNMEDISYGVSGVSPDFGHSHNASRNSAGVSSWGSIGRSGVSSTGLSHGVDSNNVLSQGEQLGHQDNQITQNGNKNTNTDTITLKRRSQRYQ